MPTYTFKLILAGQEAMVEGVNKATYDQYSYAEADAHIQGCGAGIDCLQYSLEAPSLKEAVFATVKDLGQVSPETAVIRVLAAPVPQYSETDRRFAMNPPRGHTLIKLVREHGRIGQAKDLPPLSDALLKHWILSWFRQTKSWPTAGSGEIPGSGGERWIDIDRALENGERGLPLVGTLAKYIAHHWGPVYGHSPNPLSYVRCGGVTFRLGSVLAMTHGDEYRQRSGEVAYHTKLLIAGEWVDFHGTQAQRVRDYLAQYWIAQRQLVDLDAPPQEPPTAAAESPPTQVDPAPEPENRRHFL
jgi:hypothetical protein